MQSHEHEHELNNLRFRQQKLLNRLTINERTEILTFQRFSNEHEQDALINSLQRVIFLESLKEKHGNKHI